MSHGDHSRNELSEAIMECGIKMLDTSGSSVKVSKGAVRCQLLTRWTADSSLDASSSSLSAKDCDSSFLVTNLKLMVDGQDG